MKILLDTCTFLWIITDAPDLSNKSRDLFADSLNEVYLSAVSAWEIAFKYALGRLPLPQSPGEYIPEQRDKHRIISLPLEEDATLYLDRLPEYHKDPFDRMLVCQAIVNSMAILTPDERIKQYPIRYLW
ncbi:MAG: type II toxin-antitoxin system VapC family toxin [Desulfobacteraceae bacterium]|jgi:PIN domain nuclease of toxin-antitoxin system|nr:MAG: type II toxin-antitoxin system VapC family toxin [Desulfobacteraceae bacterium]